MYEEVIDPIDRIAEHVRGSQSDNAIELFTDERQDSDGIAFKTDLTKKEHVFVSVLRTENNNLNELFGIDFNLYGDFLDEFRKHKTSLGRKSRMEFVDVLRGGFSGKDIEFASNVKNLTSSRV